MMRTMANRLCAALLAVAATAALVACGGGGSGDSASSPAVAPPAGTPPAGAPQAAMGTLRVALTDAPACGYDAVHVTVERVRVHQSTSAGDDDAGWTDIIVQPARKIDLLSLQNGIIVDLGETLLPAGHYTQIRLVLVSNKSTSLANSVTPSGGTETELDTPSATQSGLKLVNEFSVAPNQVTALVLDFDACKSIVKRGNGTYGLKPVISVVPMSLTAIVGYVQPGLTGVTVTAQKDGVVLKATQPIVSTDPNVDGRFILAPLVVPGDGFYDVVFTGHARTTSVVAGVPVVQDQATTLNSSLDPVMMPGSAYGGMAGKVDPPAARPTAWVRALQAVGPVAAVEVAHVNVDEKGEYFLNLPTAAPRLLTWSNAMVAPLNFVAQDSDAAKYTLEARATGYVAQQSSLITVVPASIGNQNFDLPVLGP